MGGVESKWMSLEPEEVGKTLRVVELETNAGRRGGERGPEMETNINF